MHYLKDDDGTTPLSSFANYLTPCAVNRSIITRKINEEISKKGKFFLTSLHFCKVMVNQNSVPTLISYMFCVY